MREVFTPHNNQNKAIQHMLRHERCAVWASMGSGKTAATLTAVDILLTLEYIAPPVLVIAPLRVARTTWPDEVEKWFHLASLKVQPILGKEPQRLKALKNKEANIFTVNFENLPWLVKTLGEDWPFQMVIVDESTRLKGFRLKKGTQRARALAKVAHRKITRLVELTGTPSPNGLQDLWGQLWFIDGGRRLGSTYTAFTQRWFRPSHNGYGIEPMPYTQDQVQREVKDICITLDVKDDMDISEPIVTPIYVSLPEKAQEKYAEMEKEMFVELEKDGITHGIEALNAAAKTMKCLQLASGAAYVGVNNSTWVEIHDEKIQALESVIEEAAGMPVLVAYHFRSDLARLKQAFKQGRELNKDPQTIKDWNEGKIPVMFAHPASAGHGLNLQHGGNILVFFSHNWDLEQFQQIIERIGPTRQKQAGYDRPMYIYHLLARGTMDEVVMKRRETKAEVQTLLLEAMKNRKEP